MFEDLRKSATESYEEFKDDPVDLTDDQPYEDYYGEPPRSTGFLGMTAAQRFVLAIMVFFMSCVLAGFFLLITGKIALPFF